MTVAEQTGRQANGRPTTEHRAVVIAGGGTAGHVVPALAVADALRADGAEVTFVGGDRAELELVPAAGYDLRTLRVMPLPRGRPVKAARAAMVAGADHDPRHFQLSWGSGRRAVPGGRC